MIERQELHCHNCNKYVQFDIDTEIDGNHVLNCPKCGHQHCRVVKNGDITDQRWQSRNGPTITLTVIAYSTTSTYTTYADVTTVTGIGAAFLYNSWTSSMY